MTVGVIVRFVSKDEAQSLSQKGDDFELFRHFNDPIENVFSSSYCQCAILECMDFFCHCLMFIRTFLGRRRESY